MKCMWRLAISVAMVFGGGAVCDHLVLAADRSSTSEIKALRARIAALEAATKPSHESKNCDRCITPKPEEYAPNKTCKIERTWRRISETPERYELIGGRWYLIIREEWTWSDRMKCETVTPR